ncbi:MAG: transketolase [Actinobacteria bacterium]|nr:transketolase [Actinomycetota bacterium]
MQELDEIAGLIRRDIISMLCRAKSGHPGGSLSATDIMTALFFGGVMDHYPSNPDDPQRDRFILSKGHAAPVLYATLARAGYFPLEELSTLRQFGSRLQGHPDSKKLPGVEVSTGSLGQGLSIASGLALGLTQNGGSQNVFVLMGDGELQEGLVWEAAMFAAHNKLSNLVAIVDNNTLQIDGSTDKVMCLGDIAAKFAAFGWRVFEADGHGIDAMITAIDDAKAVSDGPSVIIANTVKGKGVSFMEGDASWHGKAPSDEQAACALSELMKREEL